MVTSLDLFKAIKLETDQWAVPVLRVKDFNYLINKAQSNLIRRTIPSLNVSLKSNTLLSPLLKHDVTLNLNDEGVALKPDDLFQDRQLNITINNLVTNPEFLSPSRYAYVLKDFYMKPAYDKTYFTPTSEGFILFVGDVYTVSRVGLDYVKKPKQIFLSNDPVLNVDSEMDSEFNRNIIIESSRMYLENARSERYQSQVNESQIQNNL